MISLPIDDFKNEIIETVEKSAVTVISAETGAGKSTRVPEFLAEAMYDVVVTEPRRVAAVTLAERVSEELGTALGTYTGYATGFEKNYSSDTKILFATDGLQLVRELNQMALGKRVLILDEIHEMNLNMETLIAWAKKQIEAGWDTKVVIMSATLNADEIVNYFGRTITSVISVPGNLYNVSFEEKGEDYLEDEIEKAISRKENVLVFLPGKGEIEELKEALEDENAAVLPLHGELPYDEQKKCFKKYNLPKVILATNVAQTSITVPDIDTVIDSGDERRVETSGGIEGLFLKPCSKKDIEQRKGRAGRTHEGKYILCSDMEYKYRDEFGIPEIYRLSLEQVVLKLASVGIDATDIKFLHQPETEKIEAAKQLLITLGALSKENLLTDIGREMAKMPVSARIARMLVEARKYGYMQPMIKIAAILQNGSLKARGIENYIHRNGSYSSDLLYELDEFEFVRKNAPIDFKGEGINGKTYFRVLEYVKKLNSLYSEELIDVDTLDEDTVIKIVFSGMRDLVFFKEYGDYHNIEETVIGSVDRNSSCYLRSRPIIGFPHTIEFKSRWGVKERILIISLCTSITPDKLVELDSENARKEEGTVECHFFFGELSVTRRVNYYYKDYNFYSTTQEVTDEEEISKAISEYEEMKAKEALRAKEEEERRKEEYNKWLKDRYDESHFVFGENEYYVHDCHSSHPEIELYLEDLEKDLPDDAKFNGISLNFFCKGISSTSISKLRSAVGKKLAIEKASSLVGRKEKIDDSKKLMEALRNSFEEKVSVIIAGVTYEETIYKYIEVEGKNMYLVTSREKIDVSEKVKEVLQTVFKKEAEKKYSENAFFFVIKGERTLTNKGSKAYSKYRDEKIMVLESLTVDNFDDSMEYLGLIYEEAILMLG